jgi:hypothetical protein
MVTKVIVRVVHSDGEGDATPQLAEVATGVRAVLGNRLSNLCVVPELPISPFDERHGTHVADAVAGGTVEAIQEKD